jgi:hypothetical protein
MENSEICEKYVIYFSISKKYSTKIPGPILGAGGSLVLLGDGVHTQVQRRFALDPQGDARQGVRPPSQGRLSVASAGGATPMYKRQSFY